MSYPVRGKEPTGQSQFTFSTVSVIPKYRSSIQSKFPDSDRQYTRSNPFFIKCRIRDGVICFTGILYDPITNAALPAPISKGQLIRPVYLCRVPETSIVDMILFVATFASR